MKNQKNEDKKKKRKKDEEEEEDTFSINEHFGITEAPKGIPENETGKLKIIME